MTPTLLSIFAEIPDLRRGQGKMYPLASILLFTVLAMLAGAVSYVRIRCGPQVRGIGLGYDAIEYGSPHSCEFWSALLEICSGSLSGVDFFAQMFPGPGQQLMEAGVGYVGDPREHVGEPDERIDIVEPTRGDEGVHHRGAFAATVRTDEQPGFSAPGNGPEGAFGGIVGHTDAAIFKECDKSRPCVEHVIHLLANGVLRREQAALFAHPVAQVRDQRG